MQPFQGSEPIAARHSKIEKQEKRKRFFRILRKQHSVQVGDQVEAVAERTNWIGKARFAESPFEEFRIVGAVICNENGCIVDHSGLSFEVVTLVLENIMAQVLAANRAVPESPVGENLVAG